MLSLSLSLSLALCCFNWRLNWTITFSSKVRIFIVGHLILLREVGAHLPNSFGKNDNTLGFRGMTSTQVKTHEAVSVLMQCIKQGWMMALCNLFFSSYLANSHPPASSYQSHYSCQPARMKNKMCVFKFTWSHFTFSDCCSCCDICGSKVLSALSHIHKLTDAQNRLASLWLTGQRESMSLTPIVTTQTCIIFSFLIIFDIWRYFEMKLKDGSYSSAQYAGY